MSPRNQEYSAAASGQPNPEGGEELKNTIVRETPWVAISVAFHVIVIALLGAFYIGHENKKVEETNISMTVATPEPEPEKIEEEQWDRTALPDDPEAVDIVEEEIPLLDPVQTSDEIHGDENLTNDTTDPNSRDVGDSFGDVGSTSIGIGAGGHRGFGVGHAGKLGHGGMGHGKYGGRAGKSGGRATQAVVTSGLEWLKRHQDPKGFWSGDHFSDLCKSTRCEGLGEASHDIGLTGLALLAFLGAGNTINKGDYANVVRNGVKYLAGIQNEQTGSFGEPTGSEGFLYDQAIATLAMCEAYGLSENPALKKKAQRAVAFIQSARNPYRAWRYAYPPNGTNDTSVTGWMILALKSASDFKLDVDPQALAGGKTWIDEMTDPDTGRTGYIQKGGLSAREPGFAEKWPAEKVESMTAVGMLCRIFLGDDPAKSPELRNGADLLRKRLPLWDTNEGTIDYYYWYYGSYAMFQMGKDDWKAWEGKMLDAIVKTQAGKDKGCEEGSWDPQFDPWGHRGGRIYATAIMVLCAEVYYRYARVVGAR